MRILKAAALFLPLLFVAPSSWGYSSITPAALHARLVNGDTLLILDVREFSEYVAGHIAEPAGQLPGQLPLTPVCMPWNSGVTSVRAATLPRNIDIIVHCQSGGRAAKAAALLDSLGYPRVFDMGGFSAWTYETRTGMYGDGSGCWMKGSFTKSDTLVHDSARVCLTPSAFAGFDSVYCEVHFASGKLFVPKDAPVSDVFGLFRLTMLDKCGLPLWRCDSLVVQDTAGIDLIPRSVTGAALPALAQTGVTCLSGNGVWQPVNYSCRTPDFHLSSRVLRQWYNVAGFIGNAVVQGVKPAAADRSAARIARLYGLDGRLVARSAGSASAMLSRQTNGSRCFVAVMQNGAAAKFLFPR